MNDELHQSAVEKWRRDHPSENRDREQPKRLDELARLKTLLGTGDEPTHTAIVVAGLINMLADFFKETP